jgi:hypothetical protein
MTGPSLFHALRVFFRPKPSADVREAADRLRQSLRESADTSSRITAIATDVRASVRSTLAYVENDWSGHRNERS